MTAPGGALLICRDGRVIGTLSGPYVHNLPLTEPVDQVALVTALNAPPLPEANSSRVHTAPGAERSRLMRSYLAGLTAGTRERIVVRPSRAVLAPIDVGELEGLGDEYGLTLDLPVADALKRSARAVPIDRDGNEATWQEASSVRLLTRAQAAARVAAHDAARTASGSDRPSVARLADWARRAAGTRSGFGVPPGGAGAPPAVTTFAVHTARFGPPDGIDALRPAMAPTLDDLLTRTGLTAAALDPDHLVRGLLATPGSAALVTFRRAPGDPATVAWLLSNDRRSELFWLEPGATDTLVPVPTAPDADDPHLALLRDPGTRVAPMDATGLPATLDDLTGAAEPDRPRLQRVNSGFSVFDDNLRDLVDAQVAHGRYLIRELTDLSHQPFIAESPRAAATVRFERARVARAVTRLEHDTAQPPNQRRPLPLAQREQVAARIAGSVEHFGQVAEHAGHRVRDLIEDTSYQSYLSTRPDKVRERATKLLGYASKALNMSGPLFLPAGASFAPAAMELGTTAATMAAVKAFESWQLRHFRNGHAVGEVWLAHDAEPLTMARAIIKGQSDAFGLLMSAAGIGGAYVPGWPIISSAITKVFQRYLNERVERAARTLAGADPKERRTTWREVVDDVWRDLRSEVQDKLADAGTLKEFVNAVRGEPDVIGLVNIVSDVAVNAALGALLALMPPKPAAPVTGEMLRATVLGVVGTLKDGWANPEPSHGEPVDETVPADISTVDSEGRPVTHYRDSLSDDDRAYVAVTFHDTPVWGYLNRRTWAFEPVRPHESAFTDPRVWQHRVVGPDHYLEPVPGGRSGAGAPRHTRVEGSWYRPWAREFHYLFVRADGGLEWVHAMAPTTGMDTDEYNVHRHFEEHPDWLRGFAWRPGDVLALDFDRAGFTPRSGTWAARQFAYSIANLMIADHQARGGAWRSRIHVEGGGNGHNVVRSTWEHLRHEPEDHAVESGERRAAAAHDQLTRLVTEELRRITRERGLADDEVPDSTDGLFAPPTSRGSGASAAPGMAALTGDPARNRQAYAWIERLPVTPDSSAPRSPVVSDEPPSPEVTGPNSPEATSDDASSEVSDGASGRSSPAPVESGSLARALVDAPSARGGVRYGADLGQDGEEAPTPRPALPRASSKLTDPELRGIVDARIARGDHLLEVTGRLAKFGFIKESPANRFLVHHERSRLTHAVEDLRQRAGEVLGDAPRPVTPAHVAAGAELFERAVAFSRLSDHVGSRISALVLGEGVKGYLATRHDKTGVWLKRALGIGSKALSMAAPAFLPVGAAAAPAALDFATTLATHASLKAFGAWQEKVYLREHSAAEALLSHDDDPLTMARAIIKSQSEAVDLLMSAAGIGGAYVPGWPIIASAITKVLQGYLDERLTLAERRLKDAEPTATGRQLWNTIGENVWKGLRSEVEAKLKDPATIKQIVDAARGEADVLGLVNIGSDVAVSAMLGALLALMPPKPAEPVTGDMLRRSVSAMAGTAGPDSRVSVPDEAEPSTEEAVPAGIPTTDDEGRPVTRYRADRSGEGRAYVTVDFNGEPVWGHLSLDTREFEPVEPHRAAFVDSSAWYDRVLGADHYEQLPPEGSGVKTRTTVPGRWYRPSWDKFHYLYLFVRDDGTVEWAHGAAPTGRIAGPTSQIHQVLDAHPRWVRDFTWRTPRVLTVDFGEHQHAAPVDPWAERQFAYSIAEGAIAHLAAPGGAWQRSVVHVEGGGNGPGTVRGAVGHLRHVPVETAEEAGKQRAAAVLARLIRLVGEEIERIRAERGLTDDEVPPSVDALFAPPTSRGAALTASAAPGMSTRTPGETRNRQVYAWIEHVPVTPDGSAPHSPLVSDPVSPAVSETASDRLPDFTGYDRRFRTIARNLAAATGSDLNGICVEMSRRFADKVYPTGRGPRLGPGRPGAAGASVDDAELGTGHVFRQVADRNFTRVDSWDDVAARLAEAGPGGVAYLLAGRPGTIGHALVAWYDGAEPVYADLTRPPDRRITTDTRRLPAAIDLRALVVGRTGLVRPALSAPEGDSAPRVVVDASLTDDTGTRYGARPKLRTGLEIEVPVEVFDPADPDHLFEAKDDIGYGPGYGIEIDHGLKNARTGQVVNICEFVVDPLGREADGNGPTPAAVRAHRNEAVRNLLTVPRGAVVRLSEVLPAGIAPTDLLGRLWVRGGVIDNLYTQWTPDVPLHELPAILGFAAENTHPDFASEPDRPLRDGIEVGRQARNRFVEFTGGRAWEKDRRIVQGVISLIYPHLTTPVYNALFMREHGAPTKPKNFLAAASRVDFAGIRAALSPPVRLFLEQHGDWLREMVNARVNRPRLAEVAAAYGLIDADTGLVDVFRLDELTNSAMNNLLYGAVTPDGRPIPYVDMHQLMDVNVFYAEVNHEADDSIPVELRYLIAAYGDVRAVDRMSHAFDEMLEGFARPFRMSETHATELNRNNLVAIQASTRAGGALAGDMQRVAGYEDATAVAARAAQNAVAAAQDGHFADVAYAAIRARFGSGHRRTRDARTNRDDARRVNAIAQDLTVRADAQVEAWAQHAAAERQAAYQYYQDPRYGSRWTDGGVGPGSADAPPRAVGYPAGLDVAAALAGVPAREVRGAPLEFEAGPRVTSVPPRVAESYRAAGRADEVADVPADLNRIGFDEPPVEGIIAYAERIVPLADGRRLRDRETRLHLDPLDPAAAARREEIQEQVRAELDAQWNKGFEVDGELRHFTLTFVTDPADAHQVVGLTGDPAARPTQTRWPLHVPVPVLTHEVPHYWGLREETGRGQFGRRYVDDSVMGPSTADPDVPGRTVHQRHLAAIDAIGADPSLTVPDGRVGAGPARRPETGRTAADAVHRAMTIGRDPRAPAATRLRDFVAAVETLPDHDIAAAIADCAPRAYAAFVAQHGRSANLVRRPGQPPGMPDVEAAADPARMRFADVTHLLGGTPEPLTDVTELRDWTLGAADRMTLLRLPAEGDRPGHVFWLWSEPGADGPTARWIDTQEPGLLDREAFADPDDVRALAVTRPGVTALRLDSDGTPVPAGDPATPSRTVPALTLARTTPAEPGMRKALDRIAPTRIIHGTGSPDQVRAAELRDDVRTVFLSGDERADRKLVDGALSALSRRPVRIVPAAPLSGTRLDRLRTQIGRPKVPVFVPGAGQRVEVVRGDLAARWPDGLAGDWTRLGDRATGYVTVDSGHLARPVGPGTEATAGELVAWVLRESYVPVHLDPMPGELTIRFGPEIEYDAADGVDPERLNAGVVADLRRFELSEQTELARYHDTMLSGYRNDRAGWKVEHDSTVTGEIVAPILPYGPDRWRQSWYDLALVHAVIRRNGGVFSANTGGHVHVSLASFEQRPPLLVNLLRQVLHRMDLLYRLGANGLYHRGSGQANPFPPRAFDTIDGLGWEELIKLGGKKSALSLDSLKESIGDPARDHVELRVPDGLEHLGQLQLVVRILQRLVRVSTRSGPATYAPQRLGDQFGDTSEAADRAGLEMIRELFGPDAAAIDEQLRAVWGHSRWQPALELRAPRVGRMIGTVATDIGTYGGVSPLADRENTAALRRVTAGLDAPAILFHHLDARAIPEPGMPRGNLVDPRGNLNRLAQMLENHGRPTPRPLVVLFEPPGSAAVAPEHERGLAELADRYGAVLVRPRAGGSANRVTTTPAGLSTRDGWAVREPGGRVRRLGGVLRGDELAELVTRGPDAAAADLSDPGLWERMAGEPGEGGLRWVGAPPATVEPWLIRASQGAATRGRPLLVMAPDRTGPGGVPQYSLARLDALRTTLADDPLLPRTGLLLVTGDAGPVTPIRREHRIATVFRLDGDPGRSVRPGWRVVAWDGRVTELGAALDHTGIGRALGHLDTIATADVADDLATVELNAFRDGTADDGRVVTVPRDPATGAEAGTGTSIPSGRYLPGPDDALTGTELTAARELPSVPGWFVVFVHGTGDGRVRVGDRLLSAWQFERLVAGLPGAAGRDLAVVSCFTGDQGVGAGFADRLRTLWGRGVLSAGGAVTRAADGRWVSGDGRLPFVYFPAGTGEGRPVGGDLLTAIAAATAQPPAPTRDPLVTEAPSVPARDPLVAEATAPAPARDPLVTAPPGTGWDGRVLALGSWQGPSRAQLDSFREWAGDMTRAVVAVHVPSSAAGAHRTMADLETVLLRFARHGLQPVVFVKGENRNAFDALREMYRPVTIRRTSAGVDDVWQLRTADGEPDRLVERPTESLFRRADELPGGPTGHELPHVLADWLAGNDWPAREEYLRAHAAELAAPEIGEHLDRLPAAEAGPYTVLRTLVARNGGVSDPAEPRYAPVPQDGPEPDLAHDGRLPETFVVDYLQTGSSARERRPWNDRLLRLVATGALSGQEAAILSAGTGDASGEANARVFEAIDGVLAMPPEQAALPAGDNPRLARLLSDLVGCKVPPDERLAWVPRMDAFRDQLRTEGRGAHADLVEVLTYTLANC